MAEQSAIQLVEQATAAMKRRKFGRALELLDQAIQLDPDAGEVVMLRGVALAQLGRASEATDALRRATMLMPQSAKAFANLAVHLYDQGDRDEARLMADEALRHDPDDFAAKDVLATLDRGERAKGGSFEAGAAPVPATEVAVREGYGETRGHTIFALQQYEKLWNTLGYFLIAFGVVATALLVFRFPLKPLDVHAKVPIATGGVLSDSTSRLEILLWTLAGIASVTWILFDMLDRRSKFVWLVPQVVCGFCGLPWFPLAVYMWLGRE